jgi:hypothetical protein
LQQTIRRKGPQGRRTQEVHAHLPLKLNFSLAARSGRERIAPFRCLTTQALQRVHAQSQMWHCRKGDLGTRYGLELEQVRGILVFHFLA